MNVLNVVSAINKMTVKDFINYYQQMGFARNI